MDAKKWVQDEHGQWWYYLASGVRIRGELRVCRTCGKEFPYRRSGNPGHGWYCSRTCSNKADKPRRSTQGEAHWNWKGGHTNKDGYRQRWVKDADGKRRLQLEHRIVMSQHVGRPLYDYETVHHKNGDRSDNRIENLELRVGRHGKGSTEAHCPTCTCFAHG